MTTTGRSSGAQLRYTVAGTAIVSGEWRKVDQTVGVAVADGLVGEEVALEIEGEHEGPATAAEEWSQGQLLYWDDANSEFSDVSATGKVACAIAALDKAAAAATGRVILRNVANADV